ncbi:PREDICTED: uncharacterized protein LOC109239965 [Nicotiana attenuata]|uniref:uncharacterized protein LOC109239965 n=1 Tax=Nicotiana attenuata TaxID=49451 RepID=UPI00090583D2|nr:PREDICTED: uncharacterized protein LOC109239965 [Nicotiana attenuata]
MAGDKETQDIAAVLDSTNPLYMHPSESAGTVLVPVAFDSTGYRSWRRGVLRALSMENKVGFITRKCKKPNAGEASYDQWARCDDMVTSWILNSLSKDLADGLQYVSDAKELWQELEDRYDQTNGAKLYQLQKEINDLNQGTLDITRYYTKMKKLWEVLNTLSAHAQCRCQCTYGAKANMYKAEQDRRLIQFLMGLNEVYTVVRGSILMMNPLLSIAQAFSILIQEEKQREIRPNNHLIMESTSLNVNGPGNNRFRTNYNPQGNTVGQNSYRPAFPPNRSKLFCDYYKKRGHTKEKCYKLHGFPQDFKFTRGRNAGSATNVHGRCEEIQVCNNEDAESRNQNQNLQNLTRE